MKTIKLNPKTNTMILSQVATVLQKGGLAVLPSDTVYILTVDATNSTAVKKLLSFKNRWTGKAISVAVADQKMAQTYIHLNKSATRLYQSLLPGPFTLISKGKHLLAPGIEAEDGTLGIRIPDHPFLLSLVKKLQKPITATSANLSGRHPHYSLSAFLSPLSQKKKDLIDLLVDAGKLSQNLPSTVIDTTQQKLTILRRGDLLASSDQSLISTSPKATQKIAQFIFKKAFKDTKKNQPLVFCLTGDLGAGKTVFTKGMGKLLGLNHLPSPTFNILNEYKINHNSYQVFNHFDLYRLNNIYEFEEIDFLTHFKKHTISCLEWSENLGPYLPKIKKIARTIIVHLEYIDQKTRKISFLL